MYAGLTTGRWNGAGRLSHPALRQLLRFQRTATLRRLTRSFRNPRKKALAFLAVLLGLTWLSQTIFSLLFRQAADPEKFAAWLPLGLLIYSGWHLIKVSTRQVVEPFEWTPAEQEFISAAPVSRAQQITYRLTSIGAAALAKALCFSVLMLPDLNYWAAGFVGMLLGLAFVDLIRLLYELVFYGLGDRGRQTLRVAIIGSVGGLAALTIGKCLMAQSSQSDLSSPAALVFFQNVVSEVTGVVETEIGIFALAPFTVFTSIAVTQTISLQLAGNLALGCCMICGMLCAVYRVDGWMLANRKRYELKSLEASRETNSDNTNVELHRSVKAGRVPMRWQGAGSLMWRQFCSVGNYWRTLAISLLIPVLLSSLPLLADHNEGWMLLNLIGSMVFYSFLLLPSALILDFRRDINRMAVLKSLPFHPLAITVGQLAAPVSLCCAFQATVLVIASVSGKVIVWQTLLAGVLLVPVNVLIFAAENYIFLLSPYQRNKEGLDVFLRTILTFTGKGLAFALAVGLMLGWVTLLVYLSNAFALGPFISTGVFAVGLWAFTLGLASLFVVGIVRLFVRFDPSQDTPTAA